MGFSYFCLCSNNFLLSFDGKYAINSIYFVINVYSLPLYYYLTI